jgi:pimeloyl-ACP methyl ester carboxylesterase
MKRSFLVFALLVGLGMVWHGAPGIQTEAAPYVGYRAGTIFVVNGSGDSTTLSENCTEIIREHRFPLATYTLRWCQWADGPKDHCDYDAQIRGARRLADCIIRYRAAHPGEQIYLIGHSAGVHVILEAANQLPPDSVDRIVLLASSVSYCYDLRNALRCSREGIDAMYSKEDQVVALGSELLGTADNQFVKPAGAVGFLVPPPTDPDACLFAKLRQYRWHPNIAWTGHWGGHSGFTCHGFLDAYVFPKMLSNNMFQN